MKLRPFATTLTIGSFILIAVTGFCMFIGVRPGFVSVAHEFGSLVFLTAAILHCIIRHMSLMDANLTLDEAGEESL